MTSENERVVRRMVELFNQLDPDPKARNASGEFEELLGLIDPEIEFLPDRVQIDAGARRGLTAALHFWDEWFTLWEEHRFEITEIEGRGNSVLVLGHNRLKGRDGIVIDWKNQSIFTLSGGRVTHYRDFLDEEAARRAFEAGSGDGFSAPSLKVPLRTKSSIARPIGWSAGLVNVRGRHRPLLSGLRLPPLEVPIAAG